MPGAAGHGAGLREPGDLRHDVCGELFRRRDQEAGGTATDGGYLL